MSLKEEQVKRKVQLLMECLVSGLFDDEEHGLIHDIINRNVMDPEWSGYLFWPKRYGLDGSIDAAIEKAFSYKPIILGAPTEEK